MTRAQLEAYRLYFVNPYNGDGLITVERLWAFQQKQMQYDDEARAFETTILLFEGVTPDLNYWYFDDPRLFGKLVMRVTGQSYVKISSDVTPVEGSDTQWKFTDGSEYLEGTPIVVDFYEPLGGGGGGGGVFGVPFGPEFS